MKQLKEMSRDDLEELEYRLSYASKNAMDKHKRWEATQKLRLVRRELKRRSGMGGFLNRVKDWLMPEE
jgi:hypothetical protein